jgi:hypothetical protein
MDSYHSSWWLWEILDMMERLWLRELKEERGPIELQILHDPANYLLTANQ